MKDVIEDIRKKSFLISKTVKLVYFPNGNIQAHSEYVTGKVFEFYVDTNLSVKDLENAPLVEAQGITPEKEKDLRSLLRYLTPKGNAFFEYYLKSVQIKKSRERANCRVRFPCTPTLFLYLPSFLLISAPALLVTKPLKSRQILIRICVQLVVFSKVIV